MREEGGKVIIIILALFLDGDGITSLVTGDCNLFDCLAICCWGFVVPYLSTLTEEQNKGGGKGDWRGWRRSRDVMMRGWKSGRDYYRRGCCFPLSSCSPPSHAVCLSVFTFCLTTDGKGKEWEGLISEPPPLLMIKGCEIKISRRRRRRSGWEVIGNSPDIVK